MQIRKMFIVIFLLLTTSLVLADGYGVWLHTIDIGVENTGDAQISEKFHLFFDTENDRINFREKSIELGSDLRLWENFDLIFTPTIGLNNIVNGTITYSEGEDNYLEISYNLADELMAKGKETNLVEEYSIKANYLSALYDSGLWIIPDNTRVTIELPPGADLKDDVSPDAELGMNATKRTITWTGYKSANQLNVKYVLWKKINPLIDINQFVNFLFRTGEGAMIIVVFLIIIGGIIFKRKYFANKIETFVENNTVFEED